MSIPYETNNSPEQVQTAAAPQYVGHTALHGLGESEQSIAEAFPVPRGWTTLIHGTNTNKWTVGQQKVVITGYNGLSAITTEDAEKDRALGESVGNPDAFSTTSSYMNMRSSTNSSPVEVRVVFYREDLGSRRKPQPDVADIRAKLSEDMTRYISRYYQPRHPVIPRKEVLLRLGEATDGNTGKITEYFVPASVAGAYTEATKESSAQ